MKKNRPFSLLLTLTIVLFLVFATVTPVVADEIPVDTVAPTITMHDPGKSAFRTSDVLVFTANDDVGLDRIVANIRDNSSTLVRTSQTNAPSVTTTTLTHTLNLSGLPEGSYSVRYNTLDKAGKLSTTHTFNFTIDTTAPQVTITSPSSQSYQNSAITISGTASDNLSGVNSVVIHLRKVKENGNLDGFLNSIVAPVVDGVWTLVVESSSFADGNYGLTVIAKDDAGNTNGGGAHLKPFTIDNTKPTVALVNPGKTVFTASDSLTFIAEDNTALNRIVANIRDSSNTLVLPTQSPASGADYHEYVLSLSGLVDGTYSVRYNSQDSAGNISSTHTFAFTVDSTAPLATITSHDVGDYLKGTITVSGTVTDHLSGVAGATLQLRPVDQAGLLTDPLTEVAVSVVDGNWATALDTALFADGNYGLTLIAQDMAGNSSGGIDLMPLTIDNSKPTVSLVDPETTVFDPSDSLTFVGDDIIALARVVANVYSGSTLVRSTQTPAVGTVTALNHLLNLSGLADGSYTVRYNATDGAGNVSTTHTFAFTIDSTVPDIMAPVASFTSPSDQAVVSGVVLIQGTVLDDNLLRYYLLIQDANKQTVYSKTVYSSQFTDALLYSWNTSNVADGDYTVYLEARDIAGNKEGTRDALGSSVAKIVITVKNALPSNTDGSQESVFIRYFSVSFATQGGTPIPAQSVLSGTLVARPADPVREGFVFDNWYYNDTVFDFSTMPIDQEIALTATWVGETLPKTGSSDSYALAAALFALGLIMVGVGVNKAKRESEIITVINKIKSR